jgi:hypothetical protein
MLEHGRERASAGQHRWRTCRRQPEEVVLGILVWEARQVKASARVLPPEQEMNRVRLLAFAMAEVQVVGRVCFQMLRQYCQDWAEEQVDQMAAEAAALDLQID